jgi:hypothetical protein
MPSMFPVSRAQSSLHSDGRQRSLFADTRRWMAVHHLSNSTKPDKSHYCKNNCCNYCTIAYSQHQSLAGEFMMIDWPEKLTENQRRAILFVASARLVVRSRGGFGYRRHAAAIPYVIGQSLITRGFAETRVSKRPRCIQFKLTSTGRLLAAILKLRKYQ